MTISSQERDTKKVRVLVNRDVVDTNFKNGQNLAISQ